MHCTPIYRRRKVLYSEIDNEHSNNPDTRPFPTFVRYQLINSQLFHFFAGLPST